MIIVLGESLILDQHLISGTPKLNISPGLSKKKALTSLILGNLRIGKLLSLAFCFPFCAEEIGCIRAFDFEQFFWAPLKEELAAIFAAF